MGNTDRIISLIVPVYNEEGSLPTLFLKLEELSEALISGLEIIVIDNASTDESPRLIREKCAEDFRYKYVRFSRNFGPTVEPSITAGYRLASGDAAVVLYSDLQDPPELILEFEQRWLQGADVVLGVQTERQGEPLWRRMMVKVFYKAIRKLSDTEMVEGVGDFKLISRRVIDALLSLDEVGRYTRGLVSWLGFRQEFVPYARAPRHSGKSKAGFFSIAKTAVNALTSFSLRPLQIMTALGFAVSGLSFVAIIYYIVSWFMGSSVEGLTTLITLILFSTGSNLLSVGLIGEYVGRIQTEVKKRPLYVISEVVNLPDTEVYLK